MRSRGAVRGSHLPSHRRPTTIESMDVGPGELLVILVIVLVFVCADRVPRLARSLGEAIREFNRAAADDAPVRNED